MPKIERTSLGLVEALFEELDEFRAGESTPTRLRAIGMAANAIANVVMVELEYQKILRTTGIEGGSGAGGGGILSAIPGISLGTMPLGKQQPTV